MVSGENSRRPQVDENISLRWIEVAPHEAMNFFDGKSIDSSAVRIGKRACTLYEVIPVGKGHFTIIKESITEGRYMPTTAEQFRDNAPSVSANRSLLSQKRMGFT
ncbi:hypothetical protein [Streptomyces sanglieri]|uniref:hypothetical protein n=1 Tax=Streptomyces sanglieri TaxID=193460 RepID=UPI003525EDA8